MIEAVRDLLESLVARRPGPIVAWDELPDFVEVPAEPTWFVGPASVDLRAILHGLVDRAYVTHLRLTPSEVSAETGDLNLLDQPASAEVHEALFVVPRPPDACLCDLPSDLESDRFTLRDYQALLQEARRGGYEFLTFDEALGREAASPCILLRHDVDLSPRLALHMARVEAAVGVHSTYFFMISGAFYDVLEPEHREIVRQVAELGHTVGFHYDEFDDIEEGLAILSIVARRRLRHVAQHNPTLLPRRSLDATDIIDAYDPRLTGSQQFLYVSDSGMRWRQRTFADLIRARSPRIYALCHPESWTTEGRDMLSMIRMVEEAEANRRRQRYDGFAAGNVQYLRQRRETEGR